MSNIDHIHYESEAEQFSQLTIKSKCRGLEILTSCIDTKEQKVVSLKRLAEVLGVPVLTNEQITEIVNSKKFK